MSSRCVATQAKILSFPAAFGDAVRTASCSSEQTVPLRTVSLLIAVVAAIVPTALSGQNADADLIARARAIHERVITLDTHNDINTAHFTPDCNYTQRLTTQVNLPKMQEGGLDVSFLIVYVGQGPLDSRRATPDAYRQAIAKFDAVHRLTEQIAPRADRAGADAGRRDAASPRAGGRSRSSASRTAIRSAPTSRASASSTSAAAATCRSRTTATTSSRTRTPARRRTMRRTAASARSAAGHRRDEPPRHDGRRLASVEGVDDAGGRRCRRRRSSPRTPPSARSPTTAATWTTSSCWR